MINLREESLVPKVYVIQEQRNHNISPALQYGEIKVLLPPGDMNFSAGNTLAELQRGLKDFKWYEDYLLMTGDPVAIALAGWVLCDSLGFEDYVKFLKWDRQTSSYLPITVEF